MFERYTEKARRVVFFARYEASQFGASAIEAEHVLLGLLREDRGLVARFSPELRVERARKEIEKRTPARPYVETSVDMPLSPTAKRVLARAHEESERLRHRYIGTEHLLLGLLREEESPAAEVLAAYGVRLDDVRAEISAHTPAAPEGRFLMPEFAPDALRAMVGAQEEAVAAGASVADAGHLLLGILRDAESPAARLLASHGVTIDAVRRSLGGDAP
jgi:ATP-dependent Clp protease ATP-binding subunit ClpC